MILERESTQERRYSQRWSSSKPISYRVRGRRRVYEAHLRERSLNGMVIVTDSNFCPATGAYLVPADGTNSERHGFRLGYVCRTGPPENHQQSIFVEILA
ncbi:MAG TPA: hypothetical protein VG722_11210 [Tepidisphaeraceae bacterium]|nr:hypothetical protein [Tepidisphaeraceae bacterium]